jgi:hypothetical protein
MYLFFFPGWNMEVFWSRQNPLNPVQQPEEVYCHLHQCGPQNLRLEKSAKRKHGAGCWQVVGGQEKGEVVSAGS